MPIWVKCIFFFWICFAVMHCFAMIWSNEIMKKIRWAKLGIGNLPWYLMVYGLSFLLCILSIIPIAVWAIFLR